MKAIQKELGDEEGKDELAELRGQDQENEALEGGAREGDARAQESCGRCRPCRRRRLSCATILDWLLSIPWNKKSKVKKDLKLAQEILDKRSLRAGKG